MTKVAIIGCKKIQDQLCISCSKCLKAVTLKEGEFSRYEDGVELVALGNCGDCPGLIMPKLGLMKSTLKSLGTDMDVIHLGTCVKKACSSAKCPLEPEKVKTMAKEAFGVEVVLGTHNY